LQDWGGPPAFAHRRAQLAKTLQTGYVILFARSSLPEAAHYREDNDFYYFTDLQDPGAVLWMDLTRATVTVFEPLQARQRADNDGVNLLSMSPEARARLGFPNVC
jgi:hypothetical protein